MTLAAALPARAGEAPAPGAADAALARAEALAERAFALAQAGRLDEADRAMTEAVALTERALGRDHPSVGWRLARLAAMRSAAGRPDEARALIDRALRIQTRGLGPDDPAIASTLNTLGGILLQQGRRDDAAAVFERVAAMLDRLAPTRPAAASEMIRVGWLLKQIGAADRAVAVLARGVSRLEERHGEDAAALVVPLQQLAAAHLDRHDGAAAIAALERVIGIADRTLDARDRALLREQLAGIHDAERDPISAFRLREQAVPLFEQALGPEHPELAEALIRLGQSGAVLRRTDRARELLGRGIAILEGAPGEQRVRLWTGLIEAGTALGELGLYEEGLASFERAIAIIAEETGGLDDPGAITPLHGAAFMLHHLGRAREAAARAQEALATAERALGPDDAELVPLLYTLALIRQEQGEPTAARELLERAIAIAQSSLGAHPQHAALLSHLGTVLMEEGRFEEGRAAAERGLAMNERVLPPGDPDLGMSLNNLAALLVRIGDFDTARRHFERALALAEARYGQEHPNVATCAGNLASALARLGDIEQAHRLARRVVAIREKAFGPDHPSLVDGLKNMAEYERLLNAPTVRTRPLLERAVRISERANGPDHPETARTLDALANVHDTSNDHDAARPLRERALAIFENRHGPDHPDVAIALTGLGHSHALAGRHEQARPLLERSVAIIERTLGPEHPLLAVALANLGWSLRASGDREAAIPLVERALALVTARARRHVAGATPAERVRQVGSLRDALDDWLIVTRGTERAAYPAVLTWKGLAGRQGARERRLVRRSDDPATRELFDRLAATENRLAGLAHATPVGEAALARWRGRYAAAEDERSRLSRQLAERVDGLAPELPDGERTAAAVRAALAEGEALVDFIRYGARRGRDGFYVAWVVRPEAIARVELGPAGPIEEAARAFRAAVLAAEDPADATLRETGAALRDLLWSPAIEQLVGDADTLLISPDAVLATVPFAALPDGEDGFLIDRHTIVHLTAAAALVEPRAPRRGRGALLLGAIDYGAGGARDRGARFDRLPHTAGEVAAVARSIAAADAGAPCVTLTGREASEAALRARAPGRRVVHLATHGFVRADRGALLREDGPSSLVQARHAGAIDPMLLGGVALALANAAADRGGDDDGLLTGVEAAALDLDGVELVCLSACDTAGGTARSGEGVLGLVRGLREAGAANVVASLWPVSDQATRRLMERFYRSALGEDERLAPAAALRRAALALRAERVEVIDPEASLLGGREVRVPRAPWAAPRHWAAFVAYGRSR